MEGRLMKGYTFAKGKHKLKYPVHVEIKIDEIRADVVCAVGAPVKIISYAGKPLHNLERFLYPLGQFMRNHNVGRIDCGVIVNGSFNDTYRWVRSKNGPPADLKGAYITFILFDLPDLTDMPYWQRIVHRNRAASLLRDYGVPTVTPERHEASNEEEVYTHYEAARARGFEGLMVKSRDHLYEAGKRTYGWLKDKPENDADAKITGITEAVSEAGEPLGRVGSIQGTTEDGQAVSVPGIDHDTGRLWFADPSLIVGSWVEFRFTEMDRQGGYRHLRFGRVREDKA